MGVMTLAQMRDDVRHIIGGLTSAEASDTLVDRWLRWAYLHVSQTAVYQHRELLTNGTAVLATSDPDYTFASFGTSTDNVRAIKLVFNETRGRTLLPMSLRQYGERARPGGSLLEGEPTHYCAEAGTALLVWPAPSSTYNGDTLLVWFWKKPAALAPSPASELAEEWDEVIVQGAVWRGFRYRNQMDRAEVAKAEFGQLANEIADRLREDAREDMQRRLDVELVDYQSTPY